MSRSQAFQLLTKYLKNKNLLKHSFAAEASMKAIYAKLHSSDFSQAEQEIWGITGLLHDIDYELAQTTDQLDKHGLLIFDKEPDTIPEPIAHAIRAHNFEYTKVLPESDMDWAIYCVDSLTGLIVASALIHPDKKLASINTDFVLNRFKQKEFAKGAHRESIKLCEEKLGIPLAEFVELTLKAMQSIHTDLGL